MNKYFHSFLIGVSVLPVLAIMPAMAVSITADTDLSENFPDGNADWIESKQGFSGTLIVPEISVVDNYCPLFASGTNSALIIGDKDITNSLSVENTVTDSGKYAVFSQNNGVVNLAAKDVSVSGGNYAVYGYSNGIVNVETSNNLTISSEKYGVVVHANGSFGADVGNDMNITVMNGGGIYVADGGGTIDINTKNLTINSSYTDSSANHDNPNAGLSNFKSAGINDISVVATGTIDIAVSGDSNAVMVRGTGDKTKQSGHVSLRADTIKLMTDSDKYAALHVANYTGNSEDQSKLVVADIEAKNIDIKGEKLAIAVMSQGILNINGNTKISATKAIVARGDAQLYINKDTSNSLQMDGNIDFNYGGGTAVDSIVDITMSGTDSYWTGNITASHGAEANPSEEDMKVTSMSLNMKNGAVWNATAIVDTEETVNTALNNLNIDNGVVNINDATRGVTVDSAVIADATFNGGILNVGEMTVADGTNTFNNNIAGGVLTVNSGATMNIGTNTVDVDTITLNGDMLATLRDGNAQITADNFDGNGNLKLSFAGAGTYSVFGNAAFRKTGIDVSSSVYDLTWTNNDKDLIVSVKAVEDIAAETGIEENSAKAVIGMNTSTSEKLNDLGVKIQEKLAENTPESVREAEHAAKAVHPETESVHQSVATAVQTAVTNLASARMASPIVGRSGGDVELTSGGVWAQGLFNKSKQNGDFRGYTRGIAVGLDGTFNRDWMIGAGYSYAHSDINGSARDTEIDSNTVFLYGQYKPAEWYINAVANYTWSDFSEEGMALGTPVSSDYDVDAFGGTVATGYEFNTGITPELGLRYMHVNADDYKNSMDVKISAKDSDFLTGVLGAKYAFSVVADRYTTFVPQLNAAIKYDMLSDKNIATVVMPGVDSYTLNGERLSRLGGEFGVGLTMKHRSLDFSINYDIDVRKDYTSQTGMLKFRYNF